MMKTGIKTDIHCIMIDIHDYILYKSLMSYQFSSRDMSLFLCVVKGSLASSKLYGMLRFTFGRNSLDWLICSSACLTTFKNSLPGNFSEILWKINRHAVRFSYGSCVRLLMCYRSCIINILRTPWFTLFRFSTALNNLCIGCKRPS